MLIVQIFMAVIVALFLALRACRAKGGVGFVHPSSGGGGGGERVLWVGLKALLDKDISLERTSEYVLFTSRYGDARTCVTDRDYTAELLARVERQFGVVLPRSIKVVYLSDTLVRWLDPARYPRATLLLQSLFGSLAVFLSIVTADRVPPLMVDTVGIPFLYPLLKVCGVRVAAYVHYPVISTDMIRRVRRREAAFNNDALVARSTLLSHAKLMYYKMFACCYWFAGMCTDKVCVNSNWTSSHIKQLWGASRARVVYPPCNVNGLKVNAIKTRRNYVVSVGQFRPEKNHALQLRAFAEAKKSSKMPRDAKLFLVGGVRNNEDRERVHQLESLCDELGLRRDDDVEFCTSCPFQRLCCLLGQAKAGLHTMKDEHFGIVIVEYMAAGCIPIAHRSGGVLLDIVTLDTGKLCVTLDEYAAAIVEVLSLPEDSFMTIQSAALARASRFSDEVFAREYVNFFSSLLH
jgi:alpha-1,2-mannosyltransferase